MKTPSTKGILTANITYSTGVDDFGKPKVELLRLGCNVRNTKTTKIVTFKYFKLTNSELYKVEVKINKEYPNIRHNSIGVAKAHQCSLQLRCQTLQEAKLLVGNGLALRLVSRCATGVQRKQFGHLNRGFQTPHIKL